jgi:hypothetical protein
LQCHIGDRRTAGYPIDQSVQVHRVALRSDPRPPARTNSVAWMLPFAAGLVTSTSGAGTGADDAYTDGFHDGLSF